MEEPTANRNQSTGPQTAVTSSEQNPHRSPDTLTSRSKKLLRLKKQMLSPFAELIAVVTGVCSIYQFIIGMGNLSYPLLGFAVVSLFALLIPEGAPRLFALRAFAFAIDILFLGILTVVFLPISYDVQGQPSELTITCVVWLWFFYFLFFDWRFNGTPGKRMFGLRFTVRGTKRGTLRSLLRTSLRTALTLLLPVLAGISLGNSFASSPSRIGIAFALFVRTVCLIANPVSVLVLGGNRGFGDRITDTEVRIGHGASRSRHRDVKARNWIFACTVPFAGGLAISIFGYIVWANIISVKSPIQIPAKPTGKDLSTLLVWEDPGNKFKASCVAPGFRDLSKEVRSVHIDTLSENPFTVDNADIIANPTDASNLAQMNGLPIVRITSTSRISPAAYSTITRNLAMCYGAILEDGKHSTSVIQFEQLDDYGFFIIVRHENTLLGIDRKASITYGNMTDLRPVAGVAINISLDLGGYALLGRAGARNAYLDQY